MRGLHSTVPGCCAPPHCRGLLRHSLKQRQDAQRARYESVCRRAGRAVHLSRSLR